MHEIKLKFLYENASAQLCSCYITIRISALFTFWHNCSNRLMVLSHFYNVLNTIHSDLSVNIEVGARSDIGGEKKGILALNKICLFIIKQNKNCFVFLNNLTWFMNLIDSLYTKEWTIS